MTTRTFRGAQRPERVWGGDVETPSAFDLDLTVRSHGFYDLAPWSYHPERCLLARPLRLASGRVATVEVTPCVGAGAGLALRILAEGRLSGAEAREVRAQIRTCLALDEDLAPFHARIRELERTPPPRLVLPRLAWAAERGAGRLLRSPTVFEEAVKMLCTTNCTWALTRTMVKNLVENLGEPAPLGGRTFPTPEAMAERPERFYREVVRAGYRSGAMRSIACQVASGALDMERWRDPGLTLEALAGRIGELPGFGPYATEHLLRLLGHHDHLALDSWTRGKLARLRASRRAPSDRAMKRWYQPYGRFAGLAMWLELTADWFDPAPRR
jgi:3-methyladenine DNA glycosylase/8-oxoguanine DNA glycosylase